MQVAAVAVAVRAQRVSQKPGIFVSHHRMHVAVVAVAVRAQRVPQQPGTFVSHMLLDRIICSPSTRHAQSVRLLPTRTA
jgi:hypothetical protein